MAQKFVQDKVVAIDSIVEYELSSGKKEAMFSVQKAAQQLDKLGLQHDIYELPAARLPRLITTLRQHQQDPVNTPIEEVLGAARHLPKEGPLPTVKFEATDAYMQELTGGKIINDFASQRKAVFELGGDPEQIRVSENVRVRLIKDHASGGEVGIHNVQQVNKSKILEEERMRLPLFNWFDDIHVSDPTLDVKQSAYNKGIGHAVQVKVVLKGSKETKIRDYHRGGKERKVYGPEVVAGSDSHTDMQGVWGDAAGYGGVEVESAMLGYTKEVPVHKVIGIELTGEIPEGVNPGNLVLPLTKKVFEHGSQDKYIEYYGPGARKLSLEQKATILNMSPIEGKATTGFFGFDESHVDFMERTGKTADEIERFKRFAKENLMWTGEGAIVQRRKYDENMSYDLGTLEPTFSGTDQPHHVCPLREMKKVLENKTLMEDIQNAARVAIMVANAKAKRDAINKALEIDGSDKNFDRYLNKDEDYKKYLKEDYSKFQDKDYEKLFASEDFKNFQNGTNKEYEEGDYRKYLVKGASMKTSLQNHDIPGTNYQGLNRFTPVLVGNDGCTRSIDPEAMVKVGIGFEVLQELGVKIPEYISMPVTPGLESTEKKLEASGAYQAMKEAGVSVSELTCGICIGNPVQLVKFVDTRGSKLTDKEIHDLVASGKMTPVDNIDPEVKIKDGEKIFVWTASKEELVGGFGADTDKMEFVKFEGLKKKGVKITDMDEFRQKHLKGGSDVSTSNRNFAERILKKAKFNILVDELTAVALAAAGTININLMEEPIAKTKDGNDLYYKQFIKMVLDRTPERMKQLAVKGREIDHEEAAHMFDPDPEEKKVPYPKGPLFDYEKYGSRMLQPTEYKGITLVPPGLQDVKNGVMLAVLGNDVNTDNINFAGAFHKAQLNGQWVDGAALRVVKEYMDEEAKYSNVPPKIGTGGKHRTNPKVLKATFLGSEAVGVKGIKNPDGTQAQGGVTYYYKFDDQGKVIHKEMMLIPDAADRYMADGIPLAIKGGKNYAGGSSRETAAAVTRDNGVRIVFADQINRIHGDNLIEDGVAAAVIPGKIDAKNVKGLDITPDKDGKINLQVALDIDVGDRYSTRGLPELRVNGQIEMIIHKQNGQEISFPVNVRVTSKDSLESLMSGGKEHRFIRDALAKSLEVNKSSQGYEILLPKARIDTMPEYGGYEARAVKMDDTLRKSFPEAEIEKRGNGKWFVKGQLSEKSLEVLESIVERTANRKKSALSAA